MIAEGWKNELSHNHRMALEIAYSDFLDRFFHEASSDAEKSKLVIDALPNKYVDRYTSLFCLRLVICMSSVAERLAQPEQIRPIPRSTAEALALHILIQRATVLLKDVKREDADYSEFMKLIFRDTDFLQLYEAEKEEPGVDLNRRVLLPNNLEFADWFKAFERDKPVNPFVYEEWTTEQDGINFYR